MNAKLIFKKQRNNHHKTLDSVQLAGIISSGDSPFA